MTPCSIHSGSSCLTSMTGWQHCVLSANLAVQYSNNCWSTLYMTSYKKLKLIFVRIYHTFVRKLRTNLNCWIHVCLRKSAINLWLVIEISMVVTLRLILKLRCLAVRRILAINCSVYPLNIKLKLFLEVTIGTKISK